MNFSAISHRADFEQCYALNENDVVINIRTGKDIDSVSIIYQDPFIHELKGGEWFGIKEPMKPDRELKYHYIWSVTLSPKYKRLQYFFEIQSGNEIVCLFENDICPADKIQYISKQYFKFPWINPSDVVKPPEWVKHTVWYQIMPERFNRGSRFVNNGKFREWGDMSDPKFNDLYGGTLNGIREKLGYLKKLGISGIYLTPIFLSGSNHKYNTFDYKQIDPDFGSEEDLKELVREAHESGIKIMLDAVFNHCGHEFFAFKDVIENGEKSKYYKWFFINQKDFAKMRFDTEDARYYSFSFWAGMPKLNTNNPEVIAYFTDLCRYWVENWKIDGIRFDVGDEISHTFMKHLHDTLKAVNPEVFLLGEIWTDAVQWLSHNEYDSTMNYPLSNCINSFFDRKSTSRDFMYSLNYCLSLYPRQTVGVLFNFLDTHDTQRVSETCRNTDVLIQKLAVLMTIQGTPCIYYGTEISMKGKHTPYNRQCMPWEQIENGDFDGIFSEVSKLVRLRYDYPMLNSSEITYNIMQDNPYILNYTKSGITVLINASDKPYHTGFSGKILYSNLFDGKILAPYGTLIFEV